MQQSSLLLGLAEEERIKEEARQAKLKAEEEERQRILEEKRRAEEEKRREEERVRLLEEQPAVDDRTNNMRQNAIYAAKGRVKALDPKYLACNPLPDPNNERDLSSFITLWKESKDADLASSIRNCQIAENVIYEMQNIYGDAIAMYDFKKLDWCKDYIKQLRDIEIRKFD